MPSTAVASADLNRFAWRFHRQLAEAGDNHVFSPLSIASVFAMLGVGARGQTLDELRQALAFSGSDEAWHAGFGALLGELAALQREGNEDQNALSLRVVNDLWLQRGFSVGGEFLSTLQRHYGSAPTALDFATDPETARARINGKIGQDTAGLIPQLLPPGSVGVDARLVLTNALYFRAGWENRFSPRATADGEFHALDGSTARLPMMSLTDNLAYARGEGWQAVRLPYDGGSLEMLVLLPDAGRFEAVSTALDAERIDRIVAESAPTRVRLRLPRFSLRATLPLVPQLQRAGLQRVFTDAAELSGIAERLYVSAALHEAVVEVDEQGTEAAAATAAVMALTAMPRQEPEPLQLDIDRPFVFLIRATASGAPLFLGQFVAP